MQIVATDRERWKRSVEALCATRREIVSIGNRKQYSILDSVLKLNNENFIPVNSFSFFIQRLWWKHFSTLNKIINLC